MLGQKTRSAFQSHLANVPSADIQRSSFKRDFSLKTSIWDDNVTPIFLQEILPGDTINVGINSFVRLNPTITPVMDNIWMDTHFFFVPNRLVWDNWQKFNGEQIDPGDSTDFLIPKLTTPVGGYALSTLPDYFGLPHLVNNMENVSALPFRGYNLIYNEWYRDQNLQDSLPVSRGDGPDTFGLTNGYCQQRNKRHDYFTSCLPWPQKGPSIPIPSSSSVPVTSGTTASVHVNTSNIDRDWRTDSSNIMLLSGAAVGSLQNLSVRTANGWTADLTANTEATINALRQAFQLQKLYERDARGGTRYTEIIRAHFGVVSPDARLQRPEFLGGSSSMVNMHPLAQTGETGTTPQGNLSGNGTLVNTSTRISKSFTEHGYVFGLVSFRGDLSYSQGIDRHWSRNTRWDFYWPALAHIGEQAVLRKEVNCLGTSVDQQVFGYQERYGEYRYSKNMVTNVMRPGVSGSLATWNLSQEFSGTPTLNSAFIKSNTPLDRTLIVPSEAPFLCDFFFDFKHARPMPTYSVPGLVDHL